MYTHVYVTIFDDLGKRESSSFTYKSCKNLTASEAEGKLVWSIAW